MKKIVVVKAPVSPAQVAVNDDCCPPGRVGAMSTSK